MNLFLIVWTADDQECEWTHYIGSEAYLDSEREREIIVEFMKENFEYEKAETLEILQDVWSNKVDMVDNHPITVGAKVEANAVK